MHSELWCKTRN